MRTTYASLLTSLSLLVACGGGGKKTHEDAGVPDASVADLASSDASMGGEDAGPPFRQVDYIKASNARAGGEFGRQCALSADGNTLVIGALGDSSAATGVNNTTPGQGDTSELQAGAVYVFVKSGSNWVQSAYIKASNTSGDALFGEYLALSGDGKTLAVGAIFEASAATGINNTTPGQSDTSAPESGAVYVFAQTGGTWAQQAYVKASNTRTNANFGSAMALSNDGSVLAVGDSYEDSAATGINNTTPGQGDTSAAQAGAVYLYARTAGAWAQTAYVKASNARTGGLFGQSVALSSDGSVLAVGASGDSSGTKGVNGSQSDTSVTGAGAVYLFKSTASVWTQTDYLKPSNTQANGAFGVSIALSSDGTKLAVGALGEKSAAAGVDNTSPGQNDTSTAGAGAVYLFEKNGTWAQTHYVKASNPRTQVNFGYAVALSSDGTKLASTAPFETSNATGIDGDQSNMSDENAGAVYLYAKTGNTWAQEHYVKAGNTLPGMKFGFAVALSGDGTLLGATADFESSAATGINNTSPGPYDTSAVNAGAAYLFE